MLREATVHVDWCEKTMSMLREKQFEACERRLCAYPDISLFSSQATDEHAQTLFEGSYYAAEEPQMLATVEELRLRVLDQLPMEAMFLSREEGLLLDRLLVEQGEVVFDEWDDLGAAEALVSRLWCSFAAEGEEWKLRLPEALQEPLLIAMNAPGYASARERLLRFDALMNGLLYITGFLHSAQPMETMMRDVMRKGDQQARHMARRYLKAAFQYMDDEGGAMILLHPGLAEPYRLARSLNEMGAAAVELTEEMIAGGVNGIFAEEVPLHDAMCGALTGALRPEYDVREAAEDLRLLAKQGVSLRAMREVMAAMLCTLPTQAMERALEQLHQCTPRWIGWKADLQH